MEQSILAKQYQQSAVGLRKKGQYEAALHALDQALALDSENATLWNDRGATCYLAGMWVHAVADASQAIARDTSLADAYHNRAMALIRLKHLDDALLDLQRAVELYPNSSDDHFFLGNLLRQKHRTAEALQSFSRARALGRDDAAFWEEIGQVWLAVQDYPKAQMCFLRALKRKPSARRYYFCGLASSKVQEYAEALAYLDQAIVLNPHITEAHAERGIVCSQLSDLERAMESCCAAIQVSPDYAPAWANRSRVQHLREHFDEALQDAMHALQLDPNLPSAYHARALAYKARKEYENAMVDLRKFLTLETNPEQRAWAENELMVIDRDYLRGLRKVTGRLFGQA